MMITADQLGTHFAEAGQGHYECFELDQCEKCGAMVMAPNSFVVRANPAKLSGMGLKKLDMTPPALYYDDDFGGATCGC
jgi:hypothetical protein